MADMEREPDERVERLERELKALVQKVEALEADVRALNQELRTVYETEDFGARP